jgi:hypothetical protein
MYIVETWTSLSSIFLFPFIVPSWAGVHQLAPYANKLLIANPSLVKKESEATPADVRNEQQMLTNVWRCGTNYHRRIQKLPALVATVLLLATLTRTLWKMWRLHKCRRYPNRNLLLFFAKSLTSILIPLLLLLPSLSICAYHSFTSDIPSWIFWMLPVSGNKQERSASLRSGSIDMIQKLPDWRPCCYLWLLNVS